MVEYADALAGLLTDEDAPTRMNVSIALVRAGGADPAAIRAQREEISMALDDDESTVRANACTLLGNIHDDESIDGLRTLQESDPNENVRNTAAWAVDRLG